MLEEGRTRIQAEVAGTSGPGTRDVERPFYNPIMALNRDLSILAVEAFAAARGREVDFADALAGAGARSLRMANEVDADVRVHANDGDPNAIQAIQAAAKAQDLQVQTTRGPAHTFLSSRRFDIVDIDPYGSPMPFLDAAIRATRHDGMLCITATDTAALSGTYPRVCRRRYGAEHPLHGRPWRQEVGLRILQACVVRAAGRYDRAAHPMLAVCKGHWMRVMMRIRDGRGAADKAAKQIGHVASDDDGMPTWSQGTTGAAGPVWMGALQDPDFIASLPDPVDRAMGHKETPKLMRHLRAEADGAPWFVETGDLRARIGTDAPPMAAFHTALQDAGFAATRTHLHRNGTRTDAPFAALQKAWATAKAL